eukprot:SAG22_NODE_8230_length_672_cov_2.940663_2_plen_60_part_01
MHPLQGYTKEPSDGRGRRAGLPPVLETAGSLGEPSDGKRRSSWSSSAGRGWVDQLVGVGE